MTKELISSQPDWSGQQIDLLKQTVCKGVSDQEFQLFLHACKRTGLDPFMRQIYGVPRWNAELRRNAMTIQTGIDGFRLIAERTGRYAPSREPTYIYDKEGKLISATAYIKKQTADGTWHEVSATAFYSEYVQTTKDGSPTSFWRKMPHLMLAKCAEALVLRKSFPAELSNIYTSDEMSQADGPSSSADIPLSEVEIMPQLNEEEIKAFYTNFSGDEQTNRDYIKFCMERKGWSESKAITEAQKNVQKSLEALETWKRNRNKVETIAIQG